MWKIARGEIGPMPPGGPGTRGEGDAPPTRPGSAQGRVQLDVDGETVAGGPLLRGGAGFELDGGAKRLVLGFTQRALVGARVRPCALQACGVCGERRWRLRSPGCWPRLTPEDPVRSQCLAGVFVGWCRSSKCDESVTKSISLRQSFRSVLQL